MSGTFRQLYGILSPRRKKASLGFTKIRMRYSATIFILAIILSGVVGGIIAILVSQQEKEDMCDDYVPDNNTSHEDFCELFLNLDGKIERG